jgi:chromosome segregation ATPase
MSIIDIESAIRAAKDRPSMEAELQELREIVAGKSRMIQAQIKLREDLQKRADANCIDCNYHAICTGMQGELQELRERLEASEVSRKWYRYEYDRQRERTIEDQRRYLALVKRAKAAEAENNDLRNQLAVYDNRYAAMAETIERTKMELIETERARDYHIEQTTQLREEVKRLWKLAGAYDGGLHKRNCELEQLRDDLQRSRAAYDICATDYADVVVERDGLREENKRLLADNKLLAETFGGMMGIKSRHLSECEREMSAYYHAALSKKEE